MFKPTQEQKDKLKELGSNYKFINRGPLRERQAHGEMEVVKPAFTICELRDLITGKPWAEGHGDDRADALKKALESANPDNKPKTAAQIAAENVELKARLDNLESKDQPQEKKSDPAKPKSQDSSDNKAQNKTK